MTASADHWLAAAVLALAALVSTADAASAQSRSPATQDFDMPRARPGVVGRGQPRDLGGYGGRRGGGRGEWGGRPGWVPGLGLGLGLGMEVLRPPPPRRAPTVTIVEDEIEPIMRRPRARKPRAETPRPRLQAPSRAPARLAAPPPSRTPPRRAAPAPPPPAIATVAQGETRYAPGEVLVELRQGVAIAPLAARLGFDVLEERPIALLGAIVYRLKVRDGRTVPAVLARLRRETPIATAQPNWLYQLQQEAAAPPATLAPPPEVAATSPPQGAPTAAPPEPAPTQAAPAAPPPLPGQYAPDKLRLAGAHERATGRGVRVAVIDAAVDAAHPELAKALEARFDALDGADPAPTAHGTAMAGAIVAQARLTGVAPGARLLAARAFGRPAVGGVAQGASLAILRSLDWSVTSGAKVVSMSFAGPADALLSRALAAARERGVVAVAAAGNAGPTSPPLYPAADPSVVALTASDAEDRVLPAANRGAYVAAAAPGADVLTPTPNGGYDLSSGTSVAAAQAAGVVALMLERRGDLKPQEARRILMETAVDLGAPGLDPVFGAGLLDAAAAVSRLP